MAAFTHISVDIEDRVPWQRFAPSQLGLLAALGRTLDAQNRQKAALEHVLFQDDRDLHILSVDLANAPANPLGRLLVGCDHHDARQDGTHVVLVGGIRGKFVLISCAKVVPRSYSMSRWRTVVDPGSV